jgi:hypothetical protein
LQRAGFTNLETSLESTPAQVTDARSFSEFIESVILRPHLPFLPDERLRQDLLKELTILASPRYAAIRLLAAQPAGHASALD